VGISPYLRRLREAVDRELVLVPSVAVLPRDLDLSTVTRSPLGAMNVLPGREPMAAHLR